MSDTITLHGQTRTQSGKVVANLRTAGLIPAVLYGHDLANQMLTINAVELDKAYDAAGESTLIDLVIDEATPVKVLLHDVQHDPLSHRIAHADFYQVRMDEEIHTSIPLVVIGEAPAIKALGAMMVAALEELEVKCLPGALVKEITVDVSALANINDKITVGQLPIPEGMTVLTPADAAVVIINEVKQEAEPVAAEPAAAGDASATEAAKSAEPATEAKSEK